jgi:hypothetical protein
MEPSVRIIRPRYQTSACTVSHQVLSELYFVYFAKGGEWQLGDDVNMLWSVNRSFYRLDVGNDGFL